MTLIPYILQEAHGTSIHGKEMIKAQGYNNKYRNTFLDLLYYIFGSFKDVVAHLNTIDKASGYLELEKKSKWF